MQWSDAKGNQRFPRLQALAAEQGKEWTDRCVQQQMYRREYLGQYRRVYDAIKRDGTGEGSLRLGINKFENPQKHDLAFAIRKPFLDRRRREKDGAGVRSAERTPGAIPDGVPKLLKPNSMPDAPGETMPGPLDRTMPPGVSPADRMERASDGMREAADRMTEISLRTLHTVEVNAGPGLQARTKGMTATGTGVQPNVGVSMPAAERAWDV